MRPYCAATVYIWVNQRRQRGDTLQDRIESYPYLPRNGGVGTRSRVGDNLVHASEGELATIQFPSYVQAISLSGDQ